MDPVKTAELKVMFLERKVREIDNNTNVLNNQINELQHELSKLTLDRLEANRQLTEAQSDLEDAITNQSPFKKFKNSLGKVVNFFSSEQNEIETCDWFGSLTFLKTT